MAVTRSFLKGMGLTDEQVSAIIEEHTNTVNGLKDLRDQYKADADKLKDVQRELDDLKAKGGDDWHQKYTDLQKTFDDYKAEVKNQETTAKVKAAYTTLLKNANVDEKRIDAILRVTDMKGLKLDADGKLTDADKLTDSIKSEWGAFITKTATKGQDVSTPPDKAGTVLTRADIYAKDDKGRYKMSTVERQKALTEHPELMQNS